MHTPTPPPLTTPDVPSPQSVRDAATRIRGGVARTPTSRSRVLSAAIGGDVYLKLENRQATGAYKERGALNALLSLSAADRERGVVTMSAGNHGQAVAYHGTRLGVKTTVVMPETTPLLKVRRTRDYGAQVVLVGETFADAAAYAHELVARDGARLVHPYDDADVIAGQGTATLELLEDAGEELDALLVPIGGGGLIAGATLAVEAAGSSATIVGVQTELYPSFAATNGETTIAPGGVTIAEGIAVTRLGALPSKLLENAVRDVILVGESEIETAIASLLEDEKLVVEGAGAAGVAALLAHKARFAGKRVGLILCGGNIDLGTLASVIVRARLRAGRVVRIRVRMVDKPGELASAAAAIAEARVNVLDVAHHRVMGTVPSKYAELDLTVELERAEDLPAVLALVRARGFDADVVRD
ncbi:MAG TPA: threonine ammonia-lyase [Candidatus Acidoferrum sp.]|jgi:threonine dehydratase|nr:threonine ammonia-lyase [Candidatus Acidoferrum sp.]